VEDGRDPAEQAGDESAFRVAFAQLEDVLANPAAHPEDAAREMYSALCDANAADAARMAQLRRLGDRLHELERDGTLPRSMVVRSRRRRE
jgi:hypothetical protein